MDILESCLGLLLNLTTDTSQFLREFGANICDNCLALIREKLCQKSVIVRGLGTIGHILPHSIPAVDLICEKGGTVVFLEFIKVRFNPEKEASIMIAGDDKFCAILLHFQAKFGFTCMNLSTRKLYFCIQTKAQTRLHICTG